MTIKVKLQGNIQNLMRQCGYYLENHGETAFIRILSSSKSGYPRFHIYIHPVKSSSGEFNRVKINAVSYETELNLHLDQKKPIYKGTAAHSGEYDSEIVKREAERIKAILDSSSV
ncbi:MAG: hypothetical protein Q8P63_00380 [Candidatus Nealsonbacteria bacterium]|nr:hypothetical protein [Candidatus Nealsonbacteria bacterium]